MTEEDEPQPEPDEPEESAAEAEPTPSASARPKPTKAEKLEAKAARLREADERRAADAAAGHVPDRKPFVIATAALGAVAVILGILLILTFIAWQDADDSASAPQSTGATAPGTPTGTGTVGSLELTSPTVEEVVAAAKSFAVDFGTYDYQHLDTEFQEVAQKMTPSFAKSYLETSDKLKPTFEQYKTHVTAQIQGWGVTSVSTSNAVVIVLLDQTVHTSQSTTPRIDRNRLEVDLVHTDGTWLVSKLLAK